jgi:hypothetical protein
MNLSPGSEGSLRRKLEAAHFSDKPRRSYPKKASSAPASHCLLSNDPPFQVFGGETTPIPLHPRLRITTPVIFFLTLCTPYNMVFALADFCYLPTKLTMMKKRYSGNCPYKFLLRPFCLQGDLLCWRQPPTEKPIKFC